MEKPDLGHAQCVIAADRLTGNIPAGIAVHVQIDEALADLSA
jgi:hypothetical protein